MDIERKDMSELTDIDRIINRHIARLLSELEEANCPAIYIQAVKSKLSWLRADLNDMKGTEHERSYNQ